MSEQAHERDDDNPIDDDHYPEDVPEDDPLHWRALNPVRKPERDRSVEGDPED